MTDLSANPDLKAKTGIKDIIWGANMNWLNIFNDLLFIMSFLTGCTAKIKDLENMSLDQAEDAYIDMCLNNYLFKMSYAQIITHMNLLMEYNDKLLFNNCDLQKARLSARQMIATNIIDKCNSSIIKYGLDDSCIVTALHDFVRYIISIMPLEEVNKDKAYAVLSTKSLDNTKATLFEWLETCDLKSHVWNKTVKQYRKSSYESIQMLLKSRIPADEGSVVEQRYNKGLEAITSIMDEFYNKQRGSI